jgi:ABC-type antimicrobial peptide transport system permease subunit
MFKNYLKIALRNLLGHKVYSLINISGLAVGIAVCIFILLWVRDELSFNRFHKNIDNLYLAATLHDHGTKQGIGTGAPPALGPALKNDYPEVLNAARYRPSWTEALVRFGDKSFTENIGFADPEFYEMFTFPFIQGSPESPYESTYSLVITEKIAKKYFGDEPAVGKILTLDNRWEFKVTGVLKNIPRNSNLRFNFLAPMEFLRERYDRPNILDTWYNCSFYNFALLADNANLQQFNKKISNRIKKEDPTSIITPFLTSFKDYYLYGIAGRGGNIRQVRIFVIIAVLILLIACINFMNLTTARYATRAKEVGMRKVVGAQRKDLVSQFFGESMFSSFIALLFAVILVELLLPVFNSLSGKTLSLDISLGSPILWWILGITLFTGLVSGSYPALLLSSFKPIRVLRGMLGSGGKGSTFRQVLVVSQFSISIGLLIATFVVFNQLNFIKNKDLGLNKDQIVYVPIKGELENNYQLVKHELLNLPNISHVTLTSNIPTGIYQNGDGWEWEGRDPNFNPLVTYLGVDDDFLETYRMKLSAGQFFHDKLPEKTEKVVINEEFARLMGQESPVGKLIRIKDSDTGEILRFTIMGIVKDFHYTPLNREIGPIILFYKKSWWTKFRYFSLKIDTREISRTLAGVQGIVKKYNPAFPFEYRFLDEDYGLLYRSYEQMGKIFNYFAILAIFVSCLGLFGLASFVAERKTKEIGIRRALGASVLGIVGLLSRKFVRLVIIANVIAWPLAYFFMNKWLQDFAYRTGLGVGTFILSGFIALAIALFSVSYQSFRAATAAPINALRYE